MLIKINLTLRGQQGEMCLEGLYISSKDARLKTKSSYTGPKSRESWWSGDMDELKDGFLETSYEDAQNTQCKEGRATPHSSGRLMSHPEGRNLATRLVRMDDERWLSMVFFWTPPRKRRLRRLIQCWKKKKKLENGFFALLHWVRLKANWVNYYYQINL